MTRYRKIDTRVWGDAKFRRLSAPQPCGRYLWFYLLTNKLTTNIPGLFECGEHAAAEGLGWTIEGFREAFREAFEEGMVKADWEARLIWVPNAIKYNEPESPNVVKSWRVAWDELPECDLKTEAWYTLKAFIEGKTEAFGKAFGKACPKPLLNQEQEQEQEQENTEVVKPVPLAKPPAPPSSPDTKTVLTHYVKVYPDRALVIDGDSMIRRAIKKAISYGFTTQDICLAIDGNHGDKWCNDTGNTGLKWVLGDRDRIVKYRDLAKKTTRRIDPAHMRIDPEKLRADD